MVFEDVEGLTEDKEQPEYGVNEEECAITEPRGRELDELHQSESI